MHPLWFMVSHNRRGRLLVFKMNSAHWTKPPHAHSPRGGGGGLVDTVDTKCGRWRCLFYMVRGMRQNETSCTENKWVVHKTVLHINERLWIDWLWRPLFFFFFFFFAWDEDDEERGWVTVWEIEGDTTKKSDLKIWSSVCHAAWYAKLL